MKKFKSLILVLIILPCIFLLNGCSMFNSEKKAYVTNIVQTEVVGNKSTYTVYYSNGETSLLTVNNGIDGDDGDSLTIQSIKEFCEEEKIDFDEFLKKYLTVIQDSKSVQSATNIAIQSTVTIWCEFPKSDYYRNKTTSLACGAGVIYQMEETYSYVMTNYHVVYYSSCDTENKIANKIHLFQYGTSEHAYALKTKTANGTVNVLDEQGYPMYGYGDGAIEAEFIGGSMNYDIAVLKVKTEDLKKYNQHVKPVTIADDYKLSETAIAIGNPEGEGCSVTSGIISVISENISMKGADDKTTCDFRVLRIDTAVNGGNSGGGLFNLNGELIGIVNAKAISSDIDNIAYALPFDNVTKVANNILHYYKTTGSVAKVKQLILDITYTTANSRAIYNPETNTTKIVDDFKVVSIETGGVGHLIGLQVDDVVKSISINGNVHNITRSYELTELFLDVRVGDKIILNVLRGKTTCELGLVTEQGVLDSYLEIIK